jgi:hypothetical protein
MTAPCRNRIIMQHRFNKIGRYMNFHYDVMLKATENNNVMTRQKTLQAKPHKDVNFYIVKHRGV